MTGNEDEDKYIESDDYNDVTTKKNGHQSEQQKKENNDKKREKITTFIGISAVLLALLINGVATIESNYRCEQNLTISDVTPPETSASLLGSILEQDFTKTPDFINLLFLLASICLSLNILLGIIIEADSLLDNLIAKGKENSILRDFFRSQFLGIVFINSIISALICKSIIMTIAVIVITIVISVSFINTQESRQKQKNRQQTP